jgi:hypothetical protein
VVARFAQTAIAERGSDLGQGELSRT